MKHGKKSKINLLDILIVCVVLSVLTLIFARDWLPLIGGFTLALFFMWLIFIWDDIVVWWSTRK